MAARRAEPKWVNPCRMMAENGEAGGGHGMPDHKLLESLVFQARIAQNQAAEFQEDYVRRTFNTNFDSHHALFIDKDYDWLPTKDIPKKLAEEVSGEHLESLELEKTLVSVYTDLQKLAVGLEQVVWDEEDRNGAFKGAFSRVETDLRNLLCEVQTAMLEKEIPVPENVSREIMSEEFRHMDNTSMNIRNWIIYRDYLNMLEYIIQVLNHFKDKLAVMG